MIRLAVVVSLFLWSGCRDEAAAPEPKPVAPKPVEPAAGSTGKVFQAIYEDKTWGANDGGLGTSGTGSTLEATTIYRAFLQQFMKDHGIRSVVDAGCGDWEFSQAIDWTGVEYRGFDIVEAVVARNQQQYAKPNVQFVVGNIVDDELPVADLLISKDVLQHLTNQQVTAFLAKQVPKYRHVLLTNGVDASTLSGDNTDIAIGDYRPLDLTKPPFDVRGTKVLTYWDGHHMHQIVHIAK